VSPRLGIIVVAVFVAAVSACTGTPASSRPSAVEGTVTTPRRPIIVDPLPKGWSVHEVQELLPDFAPHTLYLPAASTPEQGPALAVGEVFDDGGYALCGTPSV
jgi:hypothetical protein